MTAHTGGGGAPEAAVRADDGGARGAAARCPACRGPLEAWRTVPAADPALPGAVPLDRCRACGTAVTRAPAPADVHDAGAYRSAAPRLAGVAAPVLAAFDRQRLRLVRRAVPPPARLVDVGAGRGRFVAAARAAGYLADGVEPSARGVAAAAEAYGVSLERVGILSAVRPPGSVDVVTLWHVLEHLDDPDAAIGRIATWLRPGGALVVGVPNLGSLQARLAGGRWYHLDVPRHRVHFTTAGVEALLRRHGLAPERTVHLLAEHNPFGLWQSAVSLVTTTPSFFYHLLKRNARPRPRDVALTALALPLVPVAIAVETLAGALRRGGTVAVVARTT